MTTELPDDFSRLSTPLLQLIAHTMTGSDSAKKAASVLLDRANAEANPAKRWRVSTRDVIRDMDVVRARNAERTGVRITGIVVARDANEAAAIFQSELAGNAAQRSNSRVVLQTADPRVEGLKMVIDIHCLTRENLEVVYEGEVESPLSVTQF
jgi:hypothetical protein